MENGKTTVEVRIVSNDTPEVRSVNREYKAVITESKHNPRQIWNEVMRGRKLIGLNCISFIHIEGDRTGFRVGCEDDTIAWLKERLA